MKRWIMISVFCITLGFTSGCQTVQSEETAVSVGTETGLATEEQSKEPKIAEPETSEEEKQEVTLCMVGDILLHDAVSESGLQEDGSYRYDALFSHVKEKVEQADIAMVNQEVILGGTELGLSGYPAFNGAYEVGDALADAGFDVILHATNHALDKGKKGITNCLNFWENAHPEIGVLGINGSQKEQDTVYICEKNGIQIAILNYTYGTNGIALPEDMPFAVNLLEEEKVAADMKKAKEQADFVIVCPHWGTEYNHGIDEQQEKWTELFAEAGADLVIGTHPHVIEPVEQIAAGDGESMLVYYSLGNFINSTSGTGPGTSDRMLGAMAEVTIEKDESGKTEIVSYDALPLITHLEFHTNGITTYFMEDYTKKLADKNEIRRQDEAFSLEYCQNLWKQVMQDINE